MRPRLSWQSPMVDFSKTMTVPQLIDQVAYLRSLDATTELEQASR